LSTVLDTGMGIKHTKYREYGNKREKKLGLYLLFIRTWYVFSVSELMKQKFWKKKR